MPIYPIFWIIKLRTFTYVIPNINDRNKTNLTYAVVCFLLGNSPASEYSDAGESLKSRILHLYGEETAWPMLLQVMSLLMLLYLGCTANQNIPFGYLLHLLVQGHQGPILYFLELFSFHHRCWRTRWQWTRSLQSLSIWQNRRQGVRRCHIGFMYRHSWRPYWTCFWNLPPSLMKLCSAKKQNFWSGDYSLQVLNYHNFQSTHVWLKEFHSTHVSLRPRTLYITDHKPNMYKWTKTHQAQASVFKKHNISMNASL